MLLSVGAIDTARCLWVCIVHKVVLHFTKDTMYNGYTEYSQYAEKNTLVAYLSLPLVLKDLLCPNIAAWSTSYKRGE